MSIYRKHFIPLESNPDVFNELINLLGVSPALSFQDVLALDGPHFLAGPALALILVMPTTDSYETRKAIEDAAYEEASTGEDEDIVWYKQTINNACGLYATLHALSNGEARELLGKVPFLTPFDALRVNRSKGQTLSSRPSPGLVHPCRPTNVSLSWRTPQNLKMRTQRSPLRVLQEFPTTPKTKLIFTMYASSSRARMVGYTSWTAIGKVR